MLLEGKFLGLSFFFGVRVGKLTDEIQKTDQGEAQVWGYNYHTLEGHLERGEISFQISKYLKSGEVEFKIESFSQSDRIENPFYRWGFKLFGRRLQVRFANSALQRMQKLVSERLEK